MLADEIKAGESVNIEFKCEVPKKSEKYIKSVIAFANTAGGKIVIGVDDETHEIVGVDMWVLPLIPTRAMAMLRK